MKRILLALLLLFASLPVYSQIPAATHIRIVKAEDARRFDAELEKLLGSPNAAIRERAALAAGRIGDKAAVPALVKMLQGDRSDKVREMAAFALGETESIDAADAILKALNFPDGNASVNERGDRDAGRRFLGKAPEATLLNSRVSARLIEAAGKIVAAMPQAETRAIASVPDIRARLGEAIIFTLEAEDRKGGQQNKETILLALTAALRARPEKADVTVRKFLTFTDPDIVATALNTLARLRAKNANRDARDLLETHVHAVVRANAARLLGAAEDKRRSIF